MGVLTLKGLDIKDLERITISKPIDAIVHSLKLPCNGKELYEQVSAGEQEINKMINRFDVTLSDDARPMLDFEYLKVISPENILLDGKRVISKTLIMLDDLHELRKPQRKELLDAIVPPRFPVSIWLAERLEALDLPSLVPEISGRDYDRVFLEEFWERKSKSFEKFARSISIRRTSMARPDVDMNPLDQHLVDTIDTPERHSQFERCSNSIKDKLDTISKRTKAYDKWIAEQHANSSTSFDSLIDWRVLEIQIARQEASLQTKLDDTPMDDEPDSDGRLDAVGKFFLYSDYDIPYYFGFTNISKLAMDNIEQFLEISSALFDKLESQMIKNNKKSSLFPETQEEIIKGVANSRWKQIAGIYNGRQAMSFLTRFKDFALEQTLQPNAPYAPGVTGIGISEADYKRFIDQQQQEGKYKQLAQVLQTCISHNLLRVRYDAKQGKPGNEFIIFYLNRLLCAHFGLPLGKGGWRKKIPRELCSWLDPELSRMSVREVR